MRAALHRIARRRFAGFPLPDVLLAAVFCLIAVASVLAGAPAEGTIAVTLPVSIVSTLALAWRRRTPVVAAALFAGAGLVQTFVAVSPGSLWALAVGLIVIYSVASEYSEGLAAVVGAGLVAVLLLEERIDNGVDYLFIVVLFGGVWLLGRAARSWRIRLSTAERRQQDAARLAVAEERVRLARELHDVVAHSLGVIAVQADAADAALHTDPLRAVAPVQAIRDSARAALTEVRSLLGMLRSDDGEHPARNRRGSRRSPRSSSRCAPPGCRCISRCNWATTASPHPSTWPRIASRRNASRTCSSTVRAATPRSRSCRRVTS